MSERLALTNLPTEPARRVTDALALEGSGLRRLRMSAATCRLACFVDAAMMISVAAAPHSSPSGIGRNRWEKRVPLQGFCRSSAAAVPRPGSRTAFRSVKVTPSTIFASSER